jgi:hypothetical protein
LIIEPAHPKTWLLADNARQVVGGGKKALSQAR